MRADLAPASSSQWPRPVAHFTPTRGWINDPYGARWDGRRYHLCYQAVPDGTAWSPSCSWGHAVSRDLVLWAERSPVLVPGPYELGCWSGSVVDAGAGDVRAFYTRVRHEDPAVGQIAVGRSDGSGRFTSCTDDVVVSAPPAGLSVCAFRDPFVWRDERGGWTMIVGAGLADGRGAVLQYRSDDLDRWRYAGVLQCGHIPVLDTALAQVWECPQMMRVGDRWLLVVSLLLGGSADHVAACSGSYGGGRLAAGEWQRLMSGGVLYATSLFRDRRGRPCMISWLREDPQLRVEPVGWAGALSLVSALGVDRSGRASASPHPAVLHSDMWAHRVCAPTPTSCVQVIPTVPQHVTFMGDGSADIEVRQGRHRLARVSRSGCQPELAVDRPGATPEVVPCHGSGPIELFADADVLEVFAGGAHGAWRLGLDV